MNTVNSAGIPHLDEAAAEPRACQLLTDLEVQNRSAEGFVFQRDDARSVLSLLLRPENWELLWAADVDAGIAPPDGTLRLGYEPTYFIGDHFSAICDCMCIPRWHGTDEEGVLFSPYFDRLNQHALFDAAEDAAEFLRFYLSHDWTERGDYMVAEVRLVPVTSGR